MNSNSYYFRPSSDYDPTPRIYGGENKDKIERPPRPSPNPPRRSGNYW